MNDSNYEFPAVRGIQAGREYYVVMCPLKLIPRLFIFNDHDVPADMRAQRVLNKARIPDIVRYLTANADDYILSSITACIDGDISFEPLAPSGLSRNVGILKIDMQSRILVNDGQHRRAAIGQALMDCPRIGDETISVVFYVDAGLQRSQQWFTDLNKHAIRPTKSITILYDGRDPMSKLARDLVQTVPIFSNGLTELEKTTISNRSKAIFTLSAIHQATRALLGKAKRDVIKASEAKLAEDFWIYLGEIIPDWQRIIRQETSPYDLRTLCINAYGVTLHALGIVGRAVTHPDSDWRQKLKVLADIDWARENREWQERTIIQGKISKSHESVMLTASAIKNALGIALDQEEIELEARLLSRSKG